MNCKLNFWNFKQEKLKQSLKIFKNNKYTLPTSGVEHMIPKMIKLKNERLTQEQIAKN